MMVFFVQVILFSFTLKSPFRECFGVSSRWILIGSRVGIVLNNFASQSQTYPSSKCCTKDAKRKMHPRKLQGLPSSPCEERENEYRACNCISSWDLPFQGKVHNSCGWIDLTSTQSGKIKSNDIDTIDIIKWRGQPCTYFDTPCIN